MYICTNMNNIYLEINFTRKITNMFKKKKERKKERKREKDIKLNGLEKLVTFLDRKSLQCCKCNIFIPN